MANTSNYTEENIKSLDWREHIRLRPGMYIGKSGDGSSPFRRTAGISGCHASVCAKGTGRLRR